MSKRILVMEDEEDNRQIIRNMPPIFGGSSSRREAALRHRQLFIVFADWGRSAYSTAMGKKYADPLYVRGRFQRSENRIPGRCDIDPTDWDVR